MRGHIRQRGKNKKSWSVIIELGRVNGKRKQKWYTVQGDKKDAEKFLTEKLSELDNGIKIDSKNMNVKQYMEYWYNEYCITNLSPTTYEGYKRNIDKYIVKELGYIKLEELQPLHLQTFYNKCYKINLSKKTVLQFHRIIHSALNQAMKWQLVSRNVSDCVQAPKPETYKSNFLDSIQVSKLIKLVEKTEIYIPVMIAIATGMRRGEVLGLEWNNVDLNNANIKVVQALYPTKNGLVILPPKSEKSNRIISISPSLVKILKEHKKKQEINKSLLGKEYKGNFVCCNICGQVISPTKLNHIFKKIVSNSDLPPIRFHDLRHSHASLLVSQGVQPKVISDRLGHSNINITMTLYSHVYDATNREVANNFDCFLKS